MGAPPNGRKRALGDISQCKSLPEIAQYVPTRTSHTKQPPRGLYRGSGQKNVKVSAMTQRIYTTCARVRFHPHDPHAAPERRRHFSRPSSYFACVLLCKFVGAVGSDAAERASKTLYNKNHPNGFFCGESAIRDDFPGLDTLVCEIFGSGYLGCPVRH